MKLTAFTDYSLRVLIFLADGARRPSHDRRDLERVRHLGEPPDQGGSLRSAGTAGSRPRAARAAACASRRPAAEIRVGEVVRDTEGAARPAECFATAESSCAIARCCRLRGVLAEAVGAFHAVLDRYTLADLTDAPQPLSAILHFHRPALPQSAGPTERSLA